MVRRHEQHVETVKGAFSLPANFYCAAGTGLTLGIQALVTTPKCSQVPKSGSICSHLHVLHHVLLCSVSSVPRGLRADRLFSLNCPHWPRLEQLLEKADRSEQHPVLYFESLALRQCSCLK